MSEKVRTKKPKSKVRRILEWSLIGIVGALFVTVLAGTIDAKVHEKENFNTSIRFGVGTFVVLTNSMEPEYKVNSAIVTYRKNADDIYKDYQAGNKVDITFYDAYEGSNKYTEPTKMGIGGVKKTERTTGNGGSNIPKVITHRVFDIHVNPDAKTGEGRYYFFVEGINEDAATSFGASDQYQVFTERYILGVVVLNSPFLGSVFSFVSSPWGLFVLLLIPALYLVISSGIDIVMALKEQPQEETSSGVSSLGELSAKDKERLKQEMLQQMMEKKKAEIAAKAASNEVKEPTNEAQEEEPTEAKEELTESKEEEHGQ